MKNKLLTTTAIAGLLITSSAFAQTTVTGNLDLSYKGASTSNTKSSSFRGFGKETQINISNKGKLNNGMDYVAGFSIEHDGQESGAAATTSGTAMFSENVYIDFISGGTTITIGADHIQNPDYEATNITGLADLDEVISGVNLATPSFVTNIGSPYQSYGAGVVQNIGVGNVSVYYTPSQSAIAGDSAGGHGATSSGYVDGSNSTYEVGFRGGLGVKGLDVGIFYNSTDTNDKGTNTQSADNWKIGAKYAMGAVTVGASFASQDTNGAQPQTTKETKAVALGYALSPNASIAIGHAKTADSTVGKVDEKITAIQLGYSLGPVGLGFSVGKVDAIGGTANADGKTALFQASTRF